MGEFNDNPEVRRRAENLFKHIQNTWQPTPQQLSSLESINALKRLNYAVRAERVWGVCFAIYCNNGRTQEALEKAIAHADRELEKYQTGDKF